MARLRRNPLFEQQLRRQPGYLAAVAAAAEAARLQTERFAGRPWMPRPGEAEQVEVVVEGGEVFLVNHDYAAHLKEYGSKNNPPTAPLRRGVQAAGLRLGGD